MTTHNNLNMSCERWHVINAIGKYERVSAGTVNTLGT